MMQLDFFFDLDHLPTARAKPVLVSQECSTKRRRRTQRQRAVTVLEVRLPGRVEGISLALDLEIALRCDRFPHPEQLLAAARISESPRFSHAMGKVAVGAPAPGLVRVPALGPAIHPPPNKVVELGEGLTTEHMTVYFAQPRRMGLRVSMSFSGVAPRACLQRVRTLAVRAWKLALLGVIWSLAGLPVGRSCLRKVCPKKSKPCARGVMTVFSVDSRTPRSAKKASIRGSTTSANSCREVAVTMKSSAHRT
jgi:hypothetical protein